MTSENKIGFLGWIKKHPVLSMLLLFAATALLMYAWSVDTAGHSAPTAKVNTPEGIGVSRNTIISQFSQPTIGYTFERGVDSNGLESYIGSSPDNYALIQLTGPSDNLESAGAAVVLSSDTGANIAGFTILVGLANLIDKDSVVWITDELKKAANDPDGHYEVERVFHGRIFRFTYNNMELGNMVVLVVRAA